MDSWTSIDIRVGEADSKGRTCTSQEGGEAKESGKEGWKENR